MAIGVLSYAYIHSLVDRYSAVVLRAGLMKWMGMEGPVSLYVCVRARAYVDVKWQKAYATFHSFMSLAQHFVRKQMELFLLFGSIV